MAEILIPWISTYWKRIIAAFSALVLGAYNLPVVGSFFGLIDNGLPFVPSISYKTILAIIVFIAGILMFKDEI